MLFDTEVVAATSRRLMAYSDMPLMLSEDARSYRYWYTASDSNLSYMIAMFRFVPHRVYLHAIMRAFLAKVKTRRFDVNAVVDFLESHSLDVCLHSHLESFLAFFPTDFQSRILGTDRSYANGKLTSSLGYNSFRRQLISDAIEFLRDTYCPSFADPGTFVTVDTGPWFCPQPPKELRPEDRRALWEIAFDEETFV